MPYVCASSSPPWFASSLFRVGPPAQHSPTFADVVLLCCSPRHLPPPFLLPCSQRPWRGHLVALLLPHGRQQRLATILAAAAAGVGREPPLPPVQRGAVPPERPPGPRLGVQQDGDAGRHTGGGQPSRQPVHEQQLRCDELLLGAGERQEQQRRHRAAEEDVAAKRTGGVPRASEFHV